MNGRALACLGGTVVVAYAAATASAEQAAYAWLKQPAVRILSESIPAPAGFRRQAASPDSFAAWLSGLPLKPPGTPVRLFSGADKARQDVHAAVVDIDVGRRDLQQCADAIMRLRAEWQWATRRQRDIAFNYTGGGRVSWLRWARGERPSEDGKRWAQKSSADQSYASFRKYLDQIFTYAGTYSLERELRPVPIAQIEIGDVFIRGGFPGHAVLVADIVENPATGEKQFLLLQSFMPAQDIHVLRNPKDPEGGPWYPANFDGDLVTPEWVFPQSSLRRWP